LPIFRRKKLQAFTLGLDPMMGTVAPGESVSAVVIVRPSGRETTVVNLSASSALGKGLPTGVNVSFNPPLGVPPFNSAINVSASPEITPGAYPFLIIGTGEDMKLMATYTLIVRPGKPATEKPVVEGTGEKAGED